MKRLATTVVCLVGEGVHSALPRLAAAANVRVAVPDPAAAPLDRAVEVTRAAAGTHLPFFVHDADPLGPLAEAWARRFDVESPGGPAPPGELEVARSEVLARWRAGSLDLPDFYVLLEADALPALSRHWYLGVLGGAAPRRVALAGPSLATTLRRLPAGRWWPALDELVADVERAVPDLVGRGGRPDPPDASPAAPGLARPGQGP
jgi:hypothetical protein